MGKFRKKPVEIEAFQFIYPNKSLVLWCNGRHEYHHNEEGYSTPVIAIDTLEGTMMAFPGDWVIKGVKGEFYPCKPDIFDATYELVE